MAHTQGDWINLGYRVDVDIADGLSGICEMSDWMDKEEMESNAKLIAAAPELLEACIKMVKACNEHNLIELVPEYEYMMDIINKATE